MVYLLHPLYGVDAPGHLDLSSRLATTDMGRKLGEGAVPLLGGSWVPI